MYVKQVSGVCTITTGKTKGKVKRWGAIKFPIKLKIQSEMLRLVDHPHYQASKRSASEQGACWHHCSISSWHFEALLDASVLQMWKYMRSDNDLFEKHVWCILSSDRWDLFKIMSVFWETENNLVAMTTTYGQSTIHQHSSSENLTNYFEKWQRRRLLQQPRRLLLRQWQQRGDLIFRFLYDKTVSSLDFLQYSGIIVVLITGGC